MFMDVTQTEHEVTIWMANDIPVRMFYAGRRWRVTDDPTRLRESVWSTPPGSPAGLYGWRFQATSDDDESYVFDVFRGESDWHVHRAYS
jgi:hypothetical protein